MIGSKDIEVTGAGLGNYIKTLDGGKLIFESDKACTTFNPIPDALGSTGIHIVVDPNFGFTELAGLRFKSDCVINIWNDGTIEVDKPDVLAKDEVSNSYISRKTTVEGKETIVMISTTKSPTEETKSESADVSNRYKWFTKTRSGFILDAPGSENITITGRVEYAGLKFLNTQEITASILRDGTLLLTEEGIIGINEKGGKWQSRKVELEGKMVNAMFPILSDINNASLLLSSCVVGVKTADLYEDQKLTKQIATLSVGTYINILEQKGDTFQISTDKGQTGWIMRCLLCSPSELQRRQSADEIPVTVSYISFDGKNFRLSGYHEIRNNTFAITAGQAYWMDDKTKGHTFTVASVKLEYNPKILYLFTKDNVIVSIPIWDSNEGIKSNTGKESITSTVKFNETKQEKPQILPNPAIKSTSGRKQKSDALENKFIDYVQERVKDQYGKEPGILKQLSPELQAIYLSYLLEVEVTNGGFEQYFWNYSQDYVGDTIKGLNMMGAYKHAQMLEKVENIWQLDNYEDTQISILDNEFIAMNNNLDVIRANFMQIHRKLLMSYSDSRN